MRPTGKSSVQSSNTAKVHTSPLHSGNVADDVDRAPEEDAPEGERDNGAKNSELDRRNLRQRDQKSGKQLSELGFVGQGHKRRPSRRIESGVEFLDNNAVNFLMALTMSIGVVMINAWYLGIPLDGIIGL